MSDGQVPEPYVGIHASIPFEVYQLWPAVNQSRLKCATMAHYLCNHRPEPTKPLVIGDLIHTGVGEPLAIAERYSVMPQYERDADNRTIEGEATDSKNTKYYKQKRRAYVEANRDKIIVLQDDYSTLLGVVESLAGSKRAQEYLGAAGRCELSIAWHDEETGLLCKGRIDKWCPEAGHFVDLKSCRDVGRFSSAIADYGYHVQAAFYRDGLAALCGGELFTPILCAVEPTPPYACRTAPLGEEAIEEGRREYKRKLHQIATSRKSGFWPGYDEPDVWELPPWIGNSELIVNGKKVSV